MFTKGFARRAPLWGAHVQNRWREAGIQTLEVVVALSLLSITLLGMTGLLLGTISAGAVAETSSVAANLAQQRIDELRSSPSIVPGPSTTTQSVNVPPIARPFTITTNLSAPNGMLMDVSVTVSWQVAFGSACALDPNDPKRSECVGSLRTFTRTVQTKICLIGNSKC